MVPRPRQNFLETATGKHNRRKRCLEWSTSRTQAGSIGHLNKAVSCPIALKRNKIERSQHWKVKRVNRAISQPMPLNSSQPRLTSRVTSWKTVMELPLRQESKSKQLLDGPQENQNQVADYKPFMKAQLLTRFARGQQQTILEKNPSQV